MEPASSAQATDLYYQLGLAVGNAILASLLSPLPQTPSGTGSILMLPTGTTSFGVPEGLGYSSLPQSAAPTGLRGRPFHLKNALPFITILLYSEEVLIQFGFFEPKENLRISSEHIRDGGILICAF